MKIFAIGFAAWAIAMMVVITAQVFYKRGVKAGRDIVAISVREDCKHDQLTNTYVILSQHTSKDFFQMAVQSCPTGMCIGLLPGMYGGERNTNLWFSEPRK